MTDEPNEAADGLTLSCDKCGDQFHRGEVFQEEEVLLCHANLEGWVVTDEDAVCPECQERGGLAAAQLSDSLLTDKLVEPTGELYEVHDPSVPRLVFECGPGGLFASNSSITLVASGDPLTLSIRHLPSKKNEQAGAPLRPFEGRRVRVIVEGEPDADLLRSNPEAMRQYLECLRINYPKRVVPIRQGRP